jgi:2'-5' RNA ligase
MSMIRSFVAVDLPSKFHPDVAKIEAKINMPGIKIVKPELIHVTLKFLGEVPEEKIDDIAAALEKVKMEPFQARVRGAGAFPGKSIRVVWLGLEGRFEELQRLVEEALSPFGFEDEEKKFSPHLTLARVKQPNPSTTRQLSEKIAQLDRCGPRRSRRGQEYISKKRAPLTSRRTRSTRTLSEHLLPAFWMRFWQGSNPLRRRGPGWQRLQAQ